ncbi:MAG: SEC-C domain-containing protein [Terracidiphilus sp.]
MVLGDYTQFAPCDIPPRSGAAQAWRGFIRPFSSDEEARDILRAFEQNRALEVSAGRLSAQCADLPKHPFEDYLTQMSLPCTILVLEFEDSAHPRAFLIDPPMVSRLSRCAHLRIDKSVMIEGRLFPALCVYSGNLFRFEEGQSKLVQFLDQTTTYVGKYLIWLRTRMLFRDQGNDQRAFVFRRKPQEPVTEIDLLFAPDVYWDGYWSGATAPSGPAAHLATIKRNDECWCWSGKRYQDCCRPKDLARMRSSAN